VKTTVVSKQAIETAVISVMSGRTALTTPTCFAVLQADDVTSDLPTQ
jgi:hypothetical protein